MKINLLRLILLIVMTFFFQYCSKSNNGQNDEKLPSSVKTNGKIIEFKFKDVGYDNVKIGSNIFSNWSVSEMELIDSNWVYSTN